MEQQPNIATQLKHSRAISVAVLLTALFGFGWAMLADGTREAMAVTGCVLTMSLSDFTASRALRILLGILTVALFVVLLVAS